MQREIEEKIRFWTEVLIANRDGQTPDAHDAYEQAVWNLRKLAGAAARD